MKKIFLTLLGIVGISLIIKSVLSVVIEVELDEGTVDEDRANEQF
ncbi:hypothetical protein [Staphylococcus caeli]|uniref:Uncharacterized protein n=1 Tax=Staphylococcus caeli TaxID=2201815 RepID=A0A1D4Q653_9STAP|nr:hypothetical protein [Staphylococcus caeli]SCT23575.1 Uncharacterised protein [Staphylococcus caeli]SCT30669.1 Uncharacterised protein [Staphylococcus caeli]